MARRRFEDNGMDIGAESWSILLLLLPASILPLALPLISATICWFNSSWSTMHTILLLWSVLEMFPMRRELLVIYILSSSRYSERIWLLLVMFMFPTYQYTLGGGLPPSTTHWMLTLSFSRYVTFDDEADGATGVVDGVTRRPSNSKWTARGAAVGKQLNKVFLI